MIETIFLILLSSFFGAVVCFLMLAYLYGNNTDFVKWWNDLTKRSMNDEFNQWINGLTKKIPPKDDK